MLFYKYLNNIDKQNNRCVFAIKIITQILFSVNPQKFIYQTLLTRKMLRNKKR